MDMTAAVPVHPRQQVGALCWRIKDKAPQVLLITSRDTGRWVVPKGWIMDGRTEAQSALTEAWEEAGVIGAVSEAAMGHFVYPKVLADGVALPVRVALFPVEVARLKRRYPEMRERERRWFRPSSAAERLGEPDLARLVSAFTPPRDGERASR
jgi:8-oxo-dGTP pyrophosphatase MutT (NUDIX family)